MKSAKIFTTFIFLLFFVVCISAQEKVDPKITKEIIDSLDKGAEFDDLLKIGPKRIKNLELGFSTPNELEGYEFFKEGKLKGLKLGISLKDDVAAIFGKTCADFCNYDSNWEIEFDYFDEKTLATSYYTDGKGNKTDTKKFVPLPEYYGKIRSVKLIPRKPIFFKEVNFLDEFYKFSSVSFGHVFDGSATHTASDSYTNSYGLKYTIFDKITFSTKKDVGNRQKGDLISIEYTIPKHLEEKLFIEQI